MNMYSVFKKCLSLFLLFLTSCAVTIKTQQASRTLFSSTTITPSETEMVKETIQSTKGLSATYTPTIEPTSISPTWTPLPTLSPDDAQNMVAQFLETNANCELPCWWGIQPGKTHWNEAYQFLSQFSLYIGVITQKNEAVYASVKIPVPQDIDYATYLMQDYTIHDAMVVSIKIYNFDLAPAYHLPAFLQTYGKPDEIRIRTFREEERNSQPFLMDLFYPSLGILLEYSGGGLTDMGDTLQNCLQGMNSPFIYLWSTEDTLSFEEATIRFLDTENFPDPISLEEATGMSVNSFFEGFMSDGKVCIETLKELWP
jgi:hypothetical protein